MRLLLKRNPDVHVRDCNGNTPMRVAVLHNSFEVTRAILEHCAEKGITIANERDRRKRTLLHHAAAKGFVKQLNLLIEFVGDVNAVSNINETPLHAAAWEGKNDCVHPLLAKGCEPNVKDHNQLTAMDNAINRGLLGVIKILFDAEAKRFVDLQ